jgi:hypothetical protein
MAALTATGFNYVLLPTAGAVVTSAGADTNVAAQGGHGVIVGKQRKTRLRLELTNATNNSFYPSSGGIPLATAASNYGMVRNVDYINVYGMGHTGSGLSDGVVWSYNPTAHSMVGHWAENPTAAGGVSQLPELATTWSATMNPVNTVFYVDAYGW